MIWTDTMTWESVAGTVRVLSLINCELFPLSRAQPEDNNNCHHGGEREGGEQSQNQSYSLMIEIYLNVAA